ncbi:hypothetical protein PA0180 [Candidatus Phytoplasma australiense]|uniref:Uncharacterized protein n=1 Tax=Phytoplasma australiense TaxID=59748 RepID=B1V983_PHYAS|nr:hypothetical protein PA0180 [Candidatus Phytoplasma australiense]
MKGLNLMYKNGKIHVRDLASVVVFFSVLFLTWFTIHQAFKEGKFYFQERNYKLIALEKAEAKVIRLENLVKIYAELVAKEINAEEMDIFKKTNLEERKKSIELELMVQKNLITFLRK